MQYNRKYIDEWFRIAEKDLARAYKRADEEDWEDAGFRIQQAIEKFFKGWLLNKGQSIRHTHDLEYLLDEIVELDSGFEVFRKDCQRITTYYMWDRYPRIMEDPLDEAEIRTALKCAERIVAML